MTRRLVGQAVTAALLPAADAPKVRVGLLGSGHSHFAGKLKAIQASPLYDIVGFAEGNPARKPPPGLPLLSVSQLLADASIQLVVVECSVWEALPWGKQVIDAGKHLHLEKPPGNDLAAFRQLVEAARRKRLLLQTGYLWRWHAGVEAALAAARQGWLGDVYLVRATMNADRGPKERATEAHYPGGGMFELSGHMIDRIVELLGRPTTVKSWLRHDSRFPDQLADNNLAVFEFPRALAVIAQSNQMGGAGDHRSFEIIGTEGTFIVHPESAPPRMRIHLRKAQGPYRAGWQDLTLPPQPRFVADFAELGRAIQTGQPLRQSYDHELLLHETLLRASGELA